MSTALVTGASAGIGRAFAKALAARQHDLVLVARRADKLEELAAELKREHGTAVEVLLADLTADDDLGRVEERLRDAARPVDLLVNNAGFGTFGKFAELPLQGELDEIALNLVAPVRLSRAVLPSLVERSRGGIINVSSVGGYQPTPLNATYGGTKAFLNSFTQALHEELHGTGVKAMVLCPGFTKTEFQESAGIDSSSVPGLLWQSADTVASAALKAYEKGKALCVPGPFNQTAAAFSSAAPAGITRRLAGAVLKRAEQPR